MEDKGEREEYKMLFRKLTPYWREKVVKHEYTKLGGKNWYRVTSSEEISRSGLEHILRGVEVDHIKIEKQLGGFLVQLESAEDSCKILRLNGVVYGEGTLEVSYASHTLFSGQIFEFIGNYIRMK